MWAPICQVGKWQGMFGEVEVTHKKLDTWIAAFGPDEKIPVTRGHLADPENQHASTDEPALCWISGLMKAGDLLLGNYVGWTPEGLEAITSGGYKNPSIESTDGSRLNSVALLGARTPAVEFHGERGRFAPLDMAGPCLGDGAQVLLAERLESLGEPIALPYKSPPKKITDLFDDEKGPDAWTKAFNAAFEQYDGDEGKANATAWAAIKKMGYVKGKDDIYRKSKTAAEAANQGGQEMAVEQAAKAAEERKSVLATVANWLGIGDAPPAELAALPKPEPTAESAEQKALAARVEALEKRVEDQATELQMAGATAQATALCQAAHLAPKFERPLAEYLAGKAEITLAEPEVDDKGNVVKEHKVSRNEFFTALLAAKGTTKLDDPKVLSKPPKKVLVKPFESENEGEVSDERKAEIAREAHAEALAAGKGDDAVLIKTLMVSKMNAEVK